MAPKQLWKSRPLKEAREKVSFEYYAPEAKAVFLAGTFNDWNQTACALKKARDGKWTAALTLAPGRYEYRYLVDGAWECGQGTSVECVPNVFGSWNCVVTVQ